MFTVVSRNRKAIEPLWMIDKLLEDGIVGGVYPVEIKHDFKLCDFREACELIEWSTVIILRR